MLPSGTVTFLFTDLEGSSRLWEAHPGEMPRALARHTELITEAVEGAGGHVVKDMGDGLYAAFATASAAAAAAIDAQRALQEEAWDATGSIRARMAIHSGTAEHRDGDYHGPALNRTARLMATAHGGQAVCSQATADLLADSLPEGIYLLDLGRHRLRDLARPENVFQLRHADLPEKFPALQSLDAFPGNLPTQRTRLIGREPALARVSKLLGDHRLVTLTGVGGVGKTRLALHVAAEVLDRFPDGAWFVALAAIREPDLVPGAVAAALQVPDQPGRSTTDTLRDAIGSRSLLIVLDNCEHLLDASSRLVDQLLDVCSELRILATSREALGVEGEQSWPTPSLGLPDMDGDNAPSDVAAAESVELFVERARAVRPDFELSTGNSEAVGALCARLDGIALAIELAAARVSALSPADILERLDHRFRLLTGGSRTALERHQTLQAAVDWSFDLLADRERRFFIRLSVFAGGFTLDAAHVVDADDDGDEVDVLDLLAGLIAKSLVVSDRVDGPARYRLLETLRQYGREKLIEAGEAASVRDRHAWYYLHWVEAIAPELDSPRELQSFDEMLRELDNIRAAFDWFLETGEVAAALRFEGVIRGRHNNMGEGLRRFERAVAFLPTLPPAEQVEPLAMAAWVAFQAGAHERAVELADASVASADEAGVSPHVWAFVALGLVAFWTNDTPGAIASLTRAVELSRAADDGSFLAKWWVISAVGNLGFVLGQTGQTQPAVAAGEEAVAVARSVGAPSMLGSQLWLLALALRSTDSERARELLDESLSLPYVAWTSGRGWSLVAAGQLRSSFGEQRGAIEVFAEALSLGRQHGDRFQAPTVLQGMSRAFRHLDQAEVAARLLGAAEAVGAELGIPGGAADTAARDRAATSLRKTLGDAAFEAQWRAGRALAYVDAVAFALEAAAEVEGEG